MLDKAQRRDAGAKLIALARAATQAVEALLADATAALSFVQHGELRTVARSTERHPLSLQGTGLQDYACSAQKQRRSGMSGRSPRVWTPAAALLTTWNEIDRLG